MRKERKDGGDDIDEDREDEDEENEGEDENATEEDETRKVDENAAVECLKVCAEGVGRLSVTKEAQLVRGCMANEERRHGDEVSLRELRTNIVAAAGPGRRNPVCQQLGG